MLTWQNGWQSWEAIPGVTLDVFHWQGSPTGKNALVIAGIHGDEYEGPAAVAEFVGGLDRAGLCGSLTAVPVANPPAFLAGTRTNPDGLNLARCFPGDPNGSPTQRLATALFSRLASGANYLIDLHSGGVEYVFLPVAGFYGEPSSQNRSFCAARQFGLPALWKLPVTDGVLSWEASKRGTLAIGNEYHGAGQLSADGVAAYRNGIVRCLTDWGFYQAAVSAPPRQQLLGWRLAPGVGNRALQKPSLVGTARRHRSVCRGDRESERYGARRVYRCFRRDRWRSAQQSVHPRRQLGRSGAKGVRCRIAGCSAIGANPDSRSRRYSSAVLIVPGKVRSGRSR